MNGVENIIAEFVYMPVSCHDFCSFLDCLDAQSYFLDAVRTDYEVVSTVFKTFDDFRLVSVATHKDYWDFGVFFPYFLNQFNAAFVWKSHVEKQKIQIIVLEMVYRLKPVVAENNSVTEFGKIVFGDEGKVFVYSCQKNFKRF